MPRPRKDPDVLREHVSHRTRGWVDISVTKTTKARFLAYCTEKHRGLKPDEVINLLLNKEGFLMIEKQQLTPAEVWEGFVGSQTPAEFMEESNKKGLLTVSAAVEAYVKEIPQMFGQTYTEDQLLDIAAGLTDYIRDSLK